MTDPTNNVLLARIKELEEQLKLQSANSEIAVSCLETELAQTKFSRNVAFVSLIVVFICWYFK